MVKMTPFTGGMSCTPGLDRWRPPLLHRQLSSSLLSAAAWYVREWYVQDQGDEKRAQFVEHESNCFTADLLDRSSREVAARWRQKSPPTG